LEHNKKKEIIKQLVGKPTKDIKHIEVFLLKLKIESIPSTKKVKRPYTNWFTPSLWPPTCVAMKQHGNIFSALKYLKVAYRNLGGRWCL
jgi:hypothetical protein